MRTRTILPLAAVAAALVLGACAPPRVPDALGPDPRDVGVLANPRADEIPLYTTRGVPGCRHRPAGELSSPTLLGLRDAAHQKFADAVVQVRKHVQANPPGRSGYVLPPAAVVYYTGLAVRYHEDGCAGAQPRSAPATR